MQEAAKSPTSDTEGSSGKEYRLYQMTNRASEPFNVPVLVNRKKLMMELDSDREPSPYSGTVSTTEAGGSVRHLRWRKVLQ